jgi:hypothetical protein
MAYAHTGPVFAAPLADRNRRSCLFLSVMMAMIESPMRTPAAPFTAGDDRSPTRSGPVRHQTVTGRKRQIIQHRRRHP